MNQIQTIGAGSFLLAFASIACGPTQATLPIEATPEGRQMAKAVCSARESCGCLDSRFESTEQCEAEIAASIDTALAGGVTLDSSCFETALASEVMQACPVWPLPPDGFFSCLIASGDQDLGDSCQNHDFGISQVSDCKEGLVCWGGKCESSRGPAPQLNSGDPCHSDMGCGWLNLYCGQADHQCHPRRTIGEACDDYLGCELGSYCKGLGNADTGVCAPRELPGEPCGPKDWMACDSPDFQEDPDQFYWCNPATNTCTLDMILVCRWTHPVVE